jgi:hypothetical protein
MIMSYFLGATMARTQITARTQILRRIAAFGLK